VVNLVVTPEDAELLGLADSTTRVRLVLRNPSDVSRRPQAVLPASSLFRQSSGPPVRAVAPISNPKISTLLPAK
jgi:Flp pilus assembly protein CpaB